MELYFYLPNPALGIHGRSPGLCVLCRMRQGRMEQVPRKTEKRDVPGGQCYGCG